MIQAAEIKFLRGTQGCSFLNRKKNEDISHKLNIVLFRQKIENHLNRRCKHLNRITDIRLPLDALGHYATRKRDVR